MTVFVRYTKLATERHTVPTESPGRRGERLNQEDQTETNQKQTRTTRKKIQTTLDRGVAEAKWQCDKICNNARSLKIH